LSKGSLEGREVAEELCSFQVPLSSIGLIVIVGAAELLFGFEGGTMKIEFVGGLT